MWGRALLSLGGPAVASLSDFHSAASNISHEIYNTSQKLAQLTRLARLQRARAQAGRAPRTPGPERPG